MHWRSILVSSLIAAAGCSGADFEVGAVGLGGDAVPVDDGADTGTPDTGTPTTDTSPSDSGKADTGLDDTGKPDTGAPPPDTGTPDTGIAPETGPTSWTGVFPATGDTVTLTEGPRMWAGGDSYTGTRNTGLAEVKAAYGQIHLTTASACATVEVKIGVKGGSGDWVNAGPIKIGPGVLVTDYLINLPTPVPGPVVQFGYVATKTVGASCGILWTMDASPLTLK